jgi:hypothetical protein
MKPFKVFWLTLGLTSSIVRPVSAAIILSPDRGDTQNSVPFSYGPMTSLRYQQVYGAADFSTISAGGGMITSIAFGFADPAARGGGVSNIQINLSTTFKAVDGLSTTFAQNVGNDDKQVFGPRAIEWYTNTGFAAHFELASPFFYDPKKGNLLMDMRVFQSGFPYMGMGTMAMWASDFVTDNASRVSSFNVNDATGSADTIALVTQFNVSPIPEPSTWAMLLLGAPAIFFAVYRKNKNINKRAKQWH